MDEKIKDEKKIMLVREAAQTPQERQDGKLKAVTAIDEEGDITTVDPTRKNASSLLDINTADSALEAFLKKFLEQLQNPAHTDVYIMVESIFNKLLKVDLDPQLLENYRIDPTKMLEKSNEKIPFEPLDSAKIDREDMAKKGIEWSAIEPHLKAMSYGHKSPALVEMNPELAAGVRVQTKGRVSLEQQSDGSLKVIPHYWQEKPNLNAPLYGTTLSDDVKKSLETTRHAGKPIMLELMTGKPEACFLSIDKFTNTLEVLPVADLELRDTIKGAALTSENKQKLLSGERILLEKFTSRDGYFRDAYIQVDASNRNFEFNYEGIDRNRYSQENKDVYKQKVADGTVAPREKNGIIIHKIIKGVALPEAVFKEWTEAVKSPEKRADLKACYLKDMTDSKGEKFNAWVRPNFEKEKFDFFKYNPEKSKKIAVAAEQKPAVADTQKSAQKVKRSGPRM